LEGLTLYSRLKLPQSCWESAAALEKNRKYFEANDVFPKETIDRYLRHLRKFDDKDLQATILEDKEGIKRLVAAYIHCS